MNKLKERALDIVVEGAADLFLEKSITSVTMEEIARYTGLGAASMYRYFGTKQALAMKAAVLLAGNIYQEYFSNITGDTGYEKLMCFYQSYLKIFREKRNYYRFIREFDLLFLADVKEDKSEYELEIDRFYEEFQGFYECGVRDGSIHPVEEPKVFYYATTHALLNLCKSLSGGQALLLQDRSTAAEEEIRMLTEVVLFRLRSDR